jgi:hypothetical protein
MADGMIEEQNKLGKGDPNAPEDLMEKIRTMGVRYLGYPEHPWKQMMFDELEEIATAVEQLRAKVDQYAKSWQIIDTENNDLRVQVQAVRELCKRYGHGAPFVPIDELLAVTGNGGDT